MRVHTFGVMEFSAKLRKIMARHRFSQDTLARELGVSQNLVSLWCRGKSVPDLKVALRLARVLGVPLDYLADDAVEEPPKPAGAELTEDQRVILAVVEALRLTRNEAVRRLYGPPKVDADSIRIAAEARADEAAEAAAESGKAGPAQPARRSNNK